MSLPNYPTAVPPAAKRFTLRDRLRMGLTLPAVARIVLEMREADPQGFAAQTPKEIAATVLGELQAANPEAFDDPQIDWDAVREWIEKIIAWILKVIEWIKIFI